MPPPHTVNSIILSNLVVLKGQSAAGVLVELFIAHVKLYISLQESWALCAYTKIRDVDKRL